VTPIPVPLTEQERERFAAVFQAIPFNDWAPVCVAEVMWRAGRAYSPPDVKDPPNHPKEQ
jgi:hypothetical protein